jgi:hypothetical protein
MSDDDLRLVKDFSSDRTKGMIAAELLAARATLAAVREVAMSAINSSIIHVRDDHSPNCRWCKVRRIIDGKERP